MGDMGESTAAQKNIEVERLTKQARDIRTGLRHLTEEANRGIDVERRRAAKAAQLAHVNARILRLLQMRLF